MNEQDTHPGQDVKRLQRCINDLVSLLALPALWSGGDASQIARTLMDVLQRILELELIYIQLKDPQGGVTVELARFGQSSAPAMHPGQVGAHLNRLLGDDPQKWTSQLQGHFEGKHLSITPLQLGLRSEIGVLVAGSDRSDFPTQTEDLLLRVAVNQAIIALHEASLRNQQKQLADELDRRVAERTRELGAANEQLQVQVGLLQSIPAAAWTLRPDGRPDFVNRNWLEYTGQAFDHVVSKPEAWMDAVHPDDREIASSSFWEGVRTGKDFSMESRCRRAADGAYRWQLIRAVAVRGADSSVVKFVGTTTDIEDQKQSQQELHNTQEELAKIARVMTVSQLTASIAHEVNQPLTGVITNASTCLRMLDADPPDTAGARETARRIIRDGNRASEVISRLRAVFSKRQVTPEPVDLNEAAREVIALLSSKLQRDNVSLRAEFSDDLPLATGDRVQLQQVIMNLLQNASDAMNNVHDRARQLLIQTQQDDAEHVRLTVQDSGIGLDPQTLNRLFDPFYTNKNNGMGIGLSVSRSIIESHRGRIWAKPNEGPGATFSFSIPRNPARAPSRPVAQRQPNPASRVASASTREIAGNTNG